MLECDVALTLDEYCEVFITDLQSRTPDFLNSQIKDIDLAIKGLDLT